MDVSDGAAIEATIQEILDQCGRKDILVNNAAIIHHDTLVWPTPIADWDEEMAINLFGANDHSGHAPGPV